jgi:hypothetical protein
MVQHRGERGAILDRARLGGAKPKAATHRQRFYMRKSNVLRLDFLSEGLHLRSLYLATTDTFIQCIWYVMTANRRCPSLDIETES